MIKPEPGRGGTTAGPKWQRALFCEDRTAVDAISGDVRATDGAGRGEQYTIAVATAVVC